MQRRRDLRRGSEFGRSRGPVDGFEGNFKLFDGCIAVELVCMVREVSEAAR